MHLTLSVKLLPTPEQHGLLLETMERFNAACDFIAGIAFEQRSANKIKIQQICYAEVRQRFDLSAQMAIRAIAKVCEAYKRDRRIKPTFHRHGAVVYDQRILTWKALDRVSILTVTGGRQTMACVTGGHQAGRLAGQESKVRGQADLVYRDGRFYLLVVVDVGLPDEDEVESFLGIDLGIKNIAADNDGDTFAGDAVNGLRRRHAALRARLQSKGTKSAKRLLRKRKRKERRFATDLNHIIAKRIVNKAKDTGRGIALEDLQGIRERITVRKAQRRVQHSWSFNQLRLFVTYKAALAGIPVVIIDPRNTSRTCPDCGHVAKENRPDRDHFRCVSCGMAGPADTIAAVNISAKGLDAYRRAHVNEPNAEAA